MLKPWEKDSVNLTFIVLTAIVRRVWGCTGFDGYGKACTAGKAAFPLKTQKNITAKREEDFVSEDEQLALAA